MAFTIDIFWDILRSASGENPSTLTDTMNATAKDEDARSDNYFGNVIDQLSYNTADYKRLRKFLVDLYSAHKSVVKSSAGLSDPWGMSNTDLDELFRSFGYDHSVTLKGFDENPLPNKVQLMLDLVNLYKVKGTPQALVDVLQYYGLAEVDIFEFFLRLESPTSTIFRGEAIAGTTVSPGILDVPYPEFTTSDPHWFYTEEQILALHALNDINLPSKTPYIGIRPVIDAEGPESTILSRIIQDQYGIYASGGTLEQNAEIRTTASVSSLLALYMDILYVFNTYYPTGVPSDLFICYDGTDTDYIEIKSGYEALTSQPKTREEILVKLDAYYKDFNRIQPSNFLQNPGDAKDLLTILDPTLKSDTDDLLVTDPPQEVLSSLLNDLSLWVRNNIGFGFINFSYMVDGLSAFFEDLKPVVNFFKPYRARFILLEALQFRNRLFHSLVLEDKLGAIVMDQNIYDFATANGIPCCTLNIDSTDATTYCIDSTNSDDLYYQRDTYDCGSNYDLGIATDMPREFYMEYHDKYHSALTCVPPYDGTNADLLIKDIDIVNDTTPIQDGTNNGIIYTHHIQSGGMVDYDTGGTFDCVGGQDVCVIKIEDFSPSSSSSSTSSSSSSSSSESSSSSSFSFSSSSTSSSSSSSSASLDANSRITDFNIPRIVDGSETRIVDP